MYKYHVFIAILGVVTLVVLIGGFAMVGSPVVDRLKKLDAERISDFNGLKYQIENYYRDKGYLPDDLKQLSGILKLSDPKTGQPYDYAKVSNLDFKLCTVFDTDTWGLRQEERIDYATTTKHRKGYDCISYSVPSYVRKPTPTIRPFRSPTPPALSFCPGNLVNGECIIPNDCLDSDGGYIYIKGYVSYKTPDGEGFVTIYDKCVVGANQVKENLCITNPVSAANLMWSEKIYTCPHGCDNGACIKSSFPTSTLKPIYL